MPASPLRRRAAAAVAVWAAWSVSAAAATCAVGTWTVPGGGPSVAVPELMAATARRAAVLLGEHHDNAEHHRWQLHTVAALFGYRPDMVLGFEMFPRSAQPVLDAWVRGELDEAAFLEQVNWDKVWGFPAALYMPTFRFARQARVPMVALNVDRALVARVGREGWEAVPETERAGLGDPAPPDEAYRRSLARVFAFKRRHGRRPPAEDAAAEPSEDEIVAALADPAFARFVAAQQVWDRAMAEGIAAAHGRTGAPLVVGIVGRGHAEHGWGIPHQLRALGLDDTAVLLPVDGADACAEAPAGLADAVFVLEPQRTVERPGPSLGVMLEAADGGGVRIARVLEDSVAAQSGLRTGDVVIEAAGTAVTSGGDLTAVIRRQAPGTWLPLAVRRGGETVEIVARFPTQFGPPR